MWRDENATIELTMKKAILWYVSCVKLCEKEFSSVQRIRSSNNYSISTFHDSISLVSFFANLLKNGAHSATYKTGREVHVHHAVSHYCSIADMISSQLFSCLPGLDKKQLALCAHQVSDFHCKYVRSAVH